MQSFESEITVRRSSKAHARTAAIGVILSVIAVAALMLVCSCSAGGSASGGAASESTGQGTGVWCLVSATWFNEAGNQVGAKDITRDEHGNKLAERDDMGKYVRTHSSRAFDENGFVTEAAWVVEHVEGGVSATVSTAVSSIENVFDAQGQLERSTTVTAYESGAGNREETAFTYYDNGRLHTGRSEQVSDYTLTTEYEYDERGCPLFVSETASSSVGTYGLVEAEWEFDGLGNPVGVTIAGEQAGSVSYDVICDDHGNIVEMRYENGATKASFAYEYVEAPSPCVVQQDVRLKYTYLLWLSE